MQMFNWRRRQRDSDVSLLQQNKRNLLVEDIEVIIPPSVNDSQSQQQKGYFLVMILS